MIYNKKIIIGIVAAVILCSVAIIAALMTRQPSEESDVPATIPTQTISDAPLKIEKLSLHPDINAETQTAITESIDRYIADTPHNTAPIGVVREGSYKKTTTGTTSDIVFLVDIASLKRSYKISYTTDSVEGQNILYTLCPDTSELIYPPFNCKDDLSEE
jgi:hypothetical protein